MRILLGVHEFFPNFRAGTEVLTLELARGLRAKGHEVSILTTAVETSGKQPMEPFISDYSYDGFKVFKLHCGATGETDRILQHVATADGRVTVVQQLVQKLGPDLVHFNHIIRFSAEIIPAIKKMGIPVVFTPTDFWPVCPKINLYRTFDQKTCEGPQDTSDCLRCHRAMPSFVAKAVVMIAKTSLRKLLNNLSDVYSLESRAALMARCINAADRVLPATDFLANKLNQYGVSPKRMRIIRYGVDIGDLPPKKVVPITFSVANPLHIGFIGTLSELKGCHTILQSLHQLPSNLLEKLRLSIYGNADSTDEYVRRLQKLAEKVKNNVTFEGTFAHETIGQVLRSLHILIVPSIWYESTPLVLCSAIRAGVPVIASRMGGMTEIISEGENGLLFNANDPHMLGTILKTLLKDAERLHRLRDCPPSFKRATRDYVADVEAQYKELLTRGRPERSYKVNRLSIKGIMAK